MPLSERSRAVATVFGGLNVGSVVGYAHSYYFNAPNNVQYCHFKYIFILNVLAKVTMSL